MDANPTVKCSVTFEFLTSTGSVLRKVTHKTCTLRIIRNEHRAMFVEATAGKVQPLKLSVADIQIHNKFMNEGKATVKFKKENCTMLLSNAPPAPLTKFLQTMLVKYVVDPKSNKEVSLRKQLLSNKPVQYDEISPVTNAELEKVMAKTAGRSTDTTPSPSTRKRKAASATERTPAAKKLYAPTPSFEEDMNMEQKEVLEACLAGRNVFFTGSAGTGKSFLLRKIIAALPPDGTVATASTGVAACHIGGITLHQFAGIGSGEATLENCYNMASKPLRAQIWRRCKHLIIDEISMIDGKYFEKIEAVARRVRNNEKPFGGIQLILCGDFFQLPPVFKTTTTQQSKEQAGKFCFQTKAWDECVQRVFELRQVHRQKDKKFIDLLNKIRTGEISDGIAETLTATSKQKIETDGILATRLCSHTQDANIINESKLNALQNEQMVFVAEDSSTAHTKDLDVQTPVPGRLVLKIGAQVMLLKNISIGKGLVNGARGVVKTFENGVPVVKFRNVEYVAKQERWSLKTADGNTITRKQIPLRLAWAFSIHKSQGLTLDCVEMSLSRVFEAGQAYVALSRAQSLETLRVLDFRASQVWAHPEVLKFYRKLRRRIDEMAMMVPLAPVRARDANKERVRKVKSLAKLMSKPIVTIS